MYRNQQPGYSVDQIMQNLNYFQQQLMGLPTQPRNFQEQQAIQHCKAEIAKWTDMYHRAMQQQQFQQYQQPMMQQYQQPIQQPMMPQQSYQPSIPQYGGPIQPYQQQAMMPTTINNSGNVTGRYSTKKTTQVPQQQVVQPVVVNNTQPVVEVKDDKPIELYIPNTYISSKVGITLVSSGDASKTVEEYKEEIKNMVDKRKTVGSNSDSLYKKLDLLLTDMFNMLSKNFVSKAVSADSFFNDYDDIIKYMDKLELVKDQKELDNVISYIFNTIGAIEVGKEEGKIVFKVKVNTLVISDPDSLKDFKKSMLGKEYITLDKNCLPELNGQDLEFYIVTVSNEVVSTDYYLVTSNKNTTLHSI